MQLKHVPLCFLTMGTICLAGAFTASAKPPAAAAKAAAVEAASLPLADKAD